MRTVPLLPEYFSEIAHHIKAGNPLIFPSESSYGFSGSIYSLRGIQAVEQIKNRRDKPFLLLVDKKETMAKYANTKSIQDLNIFQNPQSPTTFLLPKTKNIPDDYFPKFSEIGIRVCLFPPITGFLTFFKEPIFSTSANISGSPALYTVQDIEEKFSNIPNLLFVNIGDLKMQPPSSILRVQNGKIQKIR